VQTEIAPATAFDAAAGRYDRDAASNPMMRWLRSESLRHLALRFKPGDTVLEVGCGTGDEALALARRGVNVVATDASEGMVIVVRAKIGRSRAPGRVTARVLPAGELQELLSEYGSGSFDGAYSSLGPLNCTPDLAPVARALGDLMRPGGSLVVSLLNRRCLWETAWYLAARQPRLAFRRWSGRARGTALPGGPTIEVYYWTLKEVDDAFEPYFATRRRRALPWALPPTYAASILVGRSRLFAVLDWLEKRTATLWPFYALGDHVHLEMVRKQAPLPDLEEAERGVRAGQRL
jgi:SAM-dependent methyltransferase